MSEITDGPNSAYPPPTPNTYLTAINLGEECDKLLRSRLTTLERKLEEARKWMQHNRDCPAHTLNELNFDKRVHGITDCDCGLAAFLSTLEGEKGGKEG